METMENLKKLCEDQEKEITRLRSIIYRMKQLLFEENEANSDSGMNVVCSPPATENLFAPNRSSSAHKSPILGSSSVRVRRRLERELIQNAQNIHEEVEFLPAQENGKSSSFLASNPPSHLKAFEHDPDETFWEQAEAKPEHDMKFESSYDRLPAPEEPAYAHKSKPLKGKKRKQLPGQTCNNCQQYYKAAGVSYGLCSKHRAKHPRTNTPAGFWDLDFPSTQELRARQAATPSPKKQF